MSNPHDQFVLGDHNAICYECGRKKKASTLVKHWKGYYVCREHWEPRHPQDFAGIPPKEIPPPWTQPPAADVFVDSGVPDFVPFTPPGWDDPTT